MKSTIDGYTKGDPISTDMRDRPFIISFKCTKVYTTRINRVILDTEASHGTDRERKMPDDSDHQCPDLHGGADD